MAICSWNSREIYAVLGLSSGNSKWGLAYLRSRGSVIKEALHSDRVWRSARVSGATQEIAFLKL
jgi:hypothetical protein